MPDYSGHVCSQVYFFIQANDIAGGYYIQTACVLWMRLQLTYAGFLVRVAWWTSAWTPRYAATHSSPCLTRVALSVPGFPSSDPG